MYYLSPYQNLHEGSGLLPSHLVFASFPTACATLVYPSLASSSVNPEFILGMSAGPAVKGACERVRACVKMCGTGKG